MSVFLEHDHGWGADTQAAGNCGGMPLSVAGMRPSKTGTNIPITSGAVPAPLFKAAGVAKGHTRTRYHRGLLPDTCCIDLAGRAAILTPGVLRGNDASGPALLPTEEAHARLGAWGFALDFGCAASVHHGRSK